MPKEPTQRVWGEAKPDDVVENEQGPNGPGERPESTRFIPMRLGQHLHGVHAQEHEGDRGERPFATPLPLLQLGLSGHEESLPGSAQQYQETTMTWCTEVMSPRAPTAEAGEHPGTRLLAVAAPDEFVERVGALQHAVSLFAVPPLPDAGQDRLTIDKHWPGGWFESQRDCLANRLQSGQPRRTTNYQLSALSLGRAGRGQRPRPMTPRNRWWRILRGEQFRCQRPRPLSARMTPTGNAIPPSSPHPRGGRCRVKDPPVDRAALTECTQCQRR